MMPFHFYCDMRLLRKNWHHRWGAETLKPECRSWSGPRGNASDSLVGLLHTLSYARDRTWVVVYVNDPLSLDTEGEHIAMAWSPQAASVFRETFGYHKQISFSRKSHPCFTVTDVLRNMLANSGMSSLGPLPYIVMFVYISYLIQVIHICCRHFLKRQIEKKIKRQMGQPKKNENISE